MIINNIFHWGKFYSWVSSRVSRYPRNNLIMLNIKIKSSYRSFFGKLSELVSSRIIIFTYRIPDLNYYYVLALSSDPRASKYMNNLIRQDKLLRKSKIIKLNHFLLRDLLVIHGLKSTCEFHKLIEDNNVSLLVPYTFYRGIREYNVIGIREDLEKYLKNVKSYYGDDLVEWQRYEDLKTPELIKYMLKNSMLSVLMDKLTEQEIKVLKAAYYGGYFNYPKNSRQSDIGEQLNISKVTISIHIRKALKKILADVLDIFSFIN